MGEDRNFVCTAFSAEIEQKARDDLHGTINGLLVDALSFRLLSGLRCLFTPLRLFFPGKKIIKDQAVVVRQLPDSDENFVNGRATHRTSKADSILPNRVTLGQPPPYRSKLREITSRCISLVPS